MWNSLNKVPGGDRPGCEVFDTDAELKRRRSPIAEKEKKRGYKAEYEIGGRGKEKKSMK